MINKNSLSRRKFVSNAVVIGAAGTLGAKNFAVIFASGENRPGQKVDSESSVPGMVPPGYFLVYPCHPLGGSGIQNTGAIP